MGREKPPHDTPRAQEAPMAMGSRGTIDGDEYDAFSRCTRHFLLHWRRGEIRRIKRKFARRMRRTARLDLRKEI